MSSGSGSTWLNLIEEKRSLFTGLGCEVPATTNSEASFRHAFEVICRGQREHYIPRLSAKLFPSYGNIIEFATAIGASAPDLPSDALVALVWWASLAAIECGCTAGVRIRGLATLLADLNRAVPKFTTDVTLFPEDKKVQKPLQEVFGIYVDSYVFIVSYFSQNTSSSAFDPARDPRIEEHIQETSSSFEAARGRYDVMVDQAAQERERERVRGQQPTLEAQLSLPNVLCHDTTQPSDIHALFVSKRRLGGGSFGEVDEVREVSTGASYARKHIHFGGTASSEQIEHEVRNEVEIMQKLRHLHIASVLFYIKEPTAYSILMLPVADSDLLVYLDDCARKGFPTSSVKQIYPWFGCLLDALSYAHKLNVKHRDIKPSNILIKNGRPYLSDFGLAKDFTEQNMSASGSDQVQGTPVYRAPETLPQKPRGRPADVFALGCVYSEMLTIAQERSLKDFHDWRRTEKGSLAFRDSLPKVKEWLSGFEKNRFNGLLVDEILNMIERYPQDRPMAEKSVHNLKRERAFFCVEY